MATTPRATKQFFKLRFRCDGALSQSSKLIRLHAYLQWCSSAMSVESHNIRIPRTVCLLQCSSQSSFKSIPPQDYEQWCSSALSSRWPQHHERQNSSSNCGFAAMEL